MATTAAERVLIDTNVLVYSSVSASPFHECAQTALRTLHQEGCELWVSRQVLREYLAALSRPQVFAQPQPWAALQADVEAFGRQFRVAEDSAAVTARLLELGCLVRFGGKQVHDANLVATMLVNQIAVVLTFNGSDFRRFADLIRVEEPAPATA